MLFFVCPIISKGSQSSVLLVLSPSAASEIIALALHYFHDLYNSLRSPLIYTIRISDTAALSSQKFQTATYRICQSWADWTGVVSLGAWESRIYSGGGRVMGGRGKVFE